MPSSTGIILLLSYVWMLCFITNTLTTNYFNTKIWFDEGNIFHIKQEPFWNVFQQHRNVNKHMNWLANEISSLNHQMKLIKDQAIFAANTRNERIKISIENTDTKKNISLSKTENSQKPSSSPSITKFKNERNIYIIKLLANVSLFDGYIKELIDIYGISSIATIECIAVILEQNSNEKYLFIKLSNGYIDTYQMNKTKSLKESTWKLTKPLSVWNNAGKQLEYYRRFILNDKGNELMITNQLAEIKKRGKFNDINFFDMMGQILRIKYHIDPSSLSCILEVFFDTIYTCDGRLIYPHELKFLSDDNNLFVFHAVMMDTTTEKQIYPLDTNNFIKHGDQIFFLFNNHPQYNSFSSLTCKDCVRQEQTLIFNNNQEQTEQNADNQITEPKPIVDIQSDTFIPILQNYIVYAIVTSIVIYILIGIYLSRKQVSTGYSGKKHSISSHRGR